MEEVQDVGGTGTDAEPVRPNVYVYQDGNDTQLAVMALLKMGYMFLLQGWQE